MASIAQTVALSAVTSLVVSSIVVAGGMQFAERDTTGARIAAPQANLTELEQTVQEESPIINVVETAEPAVASVIISKDLPIISQDYETLPFGNGFNIRIPVQSEQEGTQRLEIGGGTAFFVTPDGLMLTNKHVVSDDNAQYSVLLNDGSTVEARVVAQDFLTDIALLKVNVQNVPYLQLATDDEPTLGQTVVAIGNALAEFRNTVSVGVISGLQRSITAGNPAEGTVERLSRIIQTDAAINEGNSGGPLLNLRGEVIGMNTAVAQRAQNIGFAIPVDDLQRVLDSYQRYGRIVRPYVGVRYIVITPQMAAEQNLPYDYGILVAGGENGTDQAVVPGSPAEAAGIRVGDIILETNNQRLTEEISFGDIIQRMQPGDTLNLKIARQGEVQDVSVVLQEWTD